MSSPSSFGNILGSSTVGLVAEAHHSGVDVLRLDRAVVGRSWTRSSVLNQHVLALDYASLFHVLTGCSLLVHTRNQVVCSSPYCSFTATSK